MLDHLDPSDPSFRSLLGYVAALDQQGHYATDQQARLLIRLSQVYWPLRPERAVERAMDLQAALPETHLVLTVTRMVGAVATTGPCVTKNPSADSTHAFPRREEIAALVQQLSATGQALATGRRGLRQFQSETMNQSGSQPAEPVAQSSGSRTPSS